MQSMKILTPSTYRIFNFLKKMKIYENENVDIILYIKKYLSLIKYLYVNIKIFSAQFKTTNIQLRKKLDTNSRGIRP